MLLAQTGNPGKALRVTPVSYTHLDVYKRQALQRLQADPSVAVFADITANCWPHVAPLVHADVALGTRDNTTLAALAPDLMIYIGGQVTSKYLKSLLRARPPQALWRVQPAGSAPDTYQATTALVHMAPADFLTALAARTELLSDCDYTQSWRALDVLARQQLFHLLLCLLYTSRCV